ncbi:flavodoxin family protein [Solimonas soli]|uniref:flavodoxin family protein n=1 Tax=Solimonas soli TaxID=413479 RepID=UPI0004AC7EDD|nr:hypothetical protein [Solimonas soli]
MKDALIVYYSRSGNTRRLAQQLAARLDADLEEIRERRGRGGALGFLRSLYDALREREPPIEPPNLDASGYKVVIVGSPVWTGHVAAPVRRYLTQYAGALRRLAFFCTYRDAGGPEALAEMAALREPLAETIEYDDFPSLALTEAQLREGAEEKVARFVAAVRRRTAVRGAPPRRGPRTKAVGRGRKVVPH